MSHQVEFVQDDTGSKLAVSCRDNATQEVIDLTGGTVRLRYRIAGGELQVKVMTITSPAEGVAEYLFLAGELAPGVMRAEIEITDVSGKVVTSVEAFLFQIRPKV